MAYETASRGRLIADRYRCPADRLAQDQLVLAVCIDATAPAAAVRLAPVPPTLSADAVAVWEEAWRSLAGHGLVPDLLEIAYDDEYGPVVVIAAAAEAVGHDDAMAALQADRLGAALAAAGLDLDGLGCEELGLSDDGRLRLDAVRWPAERPLAPAAGALLVRALFDPRRDRPESSAWQVPRPNPHSPRPDGQTPGFGWAVPDEAPTRRRTTRGGHGGLRHRLLWAGIGAAFIATLAVLLLPRSAAPTATLAPDLRAAAIERDLLLSAEPVAERPRTKRRRPPSPPPAPTVRAPAVVVASPAPARDPAALPTLGGDGGADAIPLASADAVPLPPLDDVSIPPASADAFGDGSAGEEDGDGWDDPAANGADFPLD